MSLGSARHNGYFLGLFIPMRDYETKREGLPLPFNFVIHPHEGL